MNAPPAVDAGLCREAPAAEPLYIKSGTHELFAWLHHPAATGRTGLGVVICNPFGYESICAHRSIRVFAEEIAAAGIPVLRFDYAGTGDSGEPAAGADLIACWTGDVAAAANLLRQRSGASHVCLLGIRLGALLATLAASGADAVDSLALVGPIVSGRRYVRDMRTTQLAGLSLSDSPGDAGVHDELEAGGFLVPADLVASLRAVDLQAAAPPRVRSVLILDDEQLPVARRWADALSQAGIATHYEAHRGLINMTITAPQFAEVPRGILDATRQWLCAKSATVPAGQPAAPALPAAPAQTTLAASDAAGAATIIERPVFIDGGIPLFGIVTEPPSGERRRRAVILLNPGADFHVGASRLYVSLARRWAGRGYHVLRLDFGGIGDSMTRAGKAVDEVFPDEAIDDIRAAIAWLQSRYAISDIALAGLCSGAYHALRAAAAGLPVSRILMVNPQNYFWKRGMKLTQVQEVEAVHNPGLYRHRIWSASAWRRIFTGQVDIGRIAMIYVARLRLQAATRLREIARGIHVRLPEDLAWDLRDIVQRGVGVVFVFARSEPGLALLRLQAGSALSGLGDGCTVTVLDEGDHIFSRRRARLAMEEALSAALYAGPRSARPGPQPLVIAAENTPLPP